MGNQTSTGGRNRQSISADDLRNSSVMGRSSSSIIGSSSTGMSSGYTGNKRYLKEHKRHGVVTVKMMNMANNRRGAENQLVHVISPKGSIIHGSVYNPALIKKSLEISSYPFLPPNEFALPDNRAHKLLVAYTGGWHMIPFPEPFSRHSGTCLILGDRNITSAPYRMRVGDCFRLGSVGLVVSEMKELDRPEQRLDAKTLEFLKDESLKFDSPDDMAPLAADEERELNLKSTGVSPQKDNKDNINDDDDSVAAESVCRTLCSGGVGGGERFICYMCYETHDTEEDALVAPCECRGDTRYLHVQCLQKWYQASITGAQTQVIRTTGNGAPACKICGSAYKTTFRKPDGRKASLLETNSEGPYLSLVVVTKHDTNPGLFNTKFRLNFGESARPPELQLEQEEDLNTISIGRSSSCNMILDYRTVSTVHAKITYADGKFLLSDRRSSNGTMVYLQDPLPLSYSIPVKLRMGRTTLSLQAKRNWSSSMRNALGPHISQHELESMPSPDDIQEILGQCHSGSFKDETQTQVGGGGSVGDGAETNTANGEDDGGGGGMGVGGGGIRGGGMGGGGGEDAPTGADSVSVAATATGSGGAGGGGGNAWGGAGGAEGSSSRGVQNSRTFTVRTLDHDSADTLDYWAGTRYTLNPGILTPMSGQGLAHETGGGDGGNLSAMSADDSVPGHSWEDDANYDADPHRETLRMSEFGGGAIFDQSATAANASVSASSPRQSEQQQQLGGATAMDAAVAAAEALRTQEAEAMRISRGLAEGDLLAHSPRPAPVYAPSPSRPSDTTKDFFSTPGRANSKGLGSATASPRGDGGAAAAATASSPAPRPQIPLSPGSASPSRGTLVLGDAADAAPSSAHDKGRTGAQSPSSASGRFSETTLRLNDHADPEQQEQLYTSLPVADAFTAYGQHREKRGSGGSGGSRPTSPLVVASSNHDNSNSNGSSSTSYSGVSCSEATSAASAAAAVVVGGALGAAMAGAGASSVAAPRKVLSGEDDGIASQDATPDAATSAAATAKQVDAPSCGGGGGGSSAVEVEADSAAHGNLAEEEMEESAALTDLGRSIELSVKHVADAPHTTKEDRTNSNRASTGGGGSPSSSSQKEG